ncbi:MAG TPA: hypothetical protein VGX68_09735 [Thermoanaerobaculia bacterium]|jgi:hypothetical protein|nr:hypothetical protein [Thermoanaerobaculia bacterium]
MDDLPLDRLGNLDLLVAGGLRGAQDVKTVANGGQWVAQLMAEHGEELVLAPGFGVKSFLGSLAVGDIPVDP